MEEEGGGEGYLDDIIYMSKSTLLGMRSQYHLIKQKIIVWHSSIYFD